MAAPAEPHRSAGQMMKDAARATAAAALHVMHHPGLSPATVAAIEKACREAAQGGARLLTLAAAAGIDICLACGGEHWARLHQQAITASLPLHPTADVHAVYAPGRLYFLRRTDPPQEEAERLRKVCLGNAGMQSCRAVRMKGVLQADHSWRVCCNRERRKCSEAIA